MHNVSFLQADIFNVHRMQYVSLHDQRVSDESDGSSIAVPDDDIVSLASDDSNVTVTQEELEMDSACQPIPDYANVAQAEMLDNVMSVVHPGQRTRVLYPAMPVEASEVVQRFIVDTGTGVDLIHRDLVRRGLSMGCRLYKFEEPIQLNTAGGDREAGASLPVQVDELGHTSWPLTINGPSALSVGYRVLSQGTDAVHFFWVNLHAPFLLLRDGYVIMLIIINRCPYLIPGAPLCQPRRVYDKEVQKLCGYRYINGSIQINIIACMNAPKHHKEYRYD